MAWIQTMITAVTSAFNGFIENVGNGVATFFKDIFLENTGTAQAPVYELSTFAAVSLVMLGIGLAIAVTTWVVHTVKRS